jgi:hypothetical protein
VTSVELIGITYLIQHTVTRDYFQNGTWTAYPGCGEEFSSLAKAMSACLRYGLREVELVLQFGIEHGRKYQIQLPLPERLLWPEAMAEKASSWDKRASACRLVRP